MEAVRPVDPITMCTIFVEEGKMAVVLPPERFATRYGAIKAKR